MKRPYLSLAHMPVFGAIACTMVFNASYAHGQAGAHEHQVAMVALALTIDLAKATFLPAAARLWSGKQRLRPILLVLLWVPALAYSTFVGYAYLTTTRTSAHVDDEARAQKRTRVQAEYDRTTSDLATAKASPDWSSTAACTRPRSNAHRAFCANVKSFEQKLDEASAMLTGIAPTHVNPELTALADVSGWALSSVSLWVSLFPAVLIELVAGLGLYALRQSADPTREERAPERATAAFSASPPPPQPTPLENAPEGRLDASGTTSQSKPPLKWKRAATP